MKNKLIFVLIVTALLLSLNVAPVAASPQSQTKLPEKLVYIDAQVQLFLERLMKYQDEYYARNGKYYQALQSHDSAPDALQAPKSLEAKPTYQDAKLGDLWTATALPYQLAWSFSVNIYDGPEGQGYVLNVTTVLDKVTYALSVNIGPETYRSADWQEVPATEF